LETLFENNFVSIILLQRIGDPTEKFYCTIHMLLDKGIFFQRKISW